eukprot:jgi/Astpho2/8855/Aster-x0827
MRGRPACSLRCGGALPAVCDAGAPCLRSSVRDSAPGLITYGIAAVHTFVSGSPVPTVFVAFSNWIDCTAGEAVVAELAPELVPMLSALEMPANFVPVTNAVLSEMQRRGVARDQLLTALRRMGEDMPCASVAMLQLAHQQGVDVRVLSDCNTVFIDHILTGARVHGLVKQVLTNTASFEKAPPAAEVDTMWSDGSASPTSVLDIGAKPASHKLVVRPRFDYQHGSHGCPLCPANLCKGQELEALRAALPYQRVIYCGDGANDLCPALALSSSDVVLARQGFTLEKLIAERSQLEDDSERVVAQVRVWRDHSQLLQIVSELISPAGLQ